MARRRLLHLESGDAHARPRRPLGCGGAWRQMGEVLVKDGPAASDRRVGHAGSYASSGRHRTVRCTGIAVLSLLDGGQGPWFF